MNSEGRRPELGEAQEPAEGSGQDALEEVLDEYMISVGTPTHQALVEWIRRYPQYAQELADFTVAWGLVEHVPNYEATAQPSDEELGQLVKRQMGIVHKMMEKHAPSAARTAINGIIAEGRAKGLSIAQLAQSSGLSIPLITKLDRRLIRYATIPGQVAASIARALEREVETVVQYLQGSALLAPGANYKSEEAPELPQQQDFADAVRSDKTLTSEQRQRLLN